MKYMDFYNRLNNPIEDKETLRKLCDVYANSLYYPGEFYGGLTSIYDRKPSWNYNQKDKDEFYVYTFNKYKVGFIKLVDQYYDNLKSKPKVLETYLKVRDYFLSLPQMTTEQDVKKAFNPKTDDVSLKDMLRKLNWDNYSSSWTIMQSSAVNLRKEEQFDVEHRLYLNIARQDFYKMASLFMKKCEERGLPFDFKFNDEGQRADSFVIYSNMEYLMQYVDILREIAKENPHIKENSANPPILTGKIDDWIGFGSEPGKDENGQNQSFNMVRATAIEKAIDSYFVEWLRENKDVKIRYHEKDLSLVDYLTEKSMTDSLKESNLSENQKTSIRQSSYKKLFDYVSKFMSGYLIDGHYDKNIVSISDKFSIDVPWFYIATNLRNLVPSLIEIDDNFVAGLKSKIKEELEKNNVSSEKCCCDVWTKEQFRLADEKMTDDTINRNSKLGNNTNTYASSDSTYRLTKGQIIQDEFRGQKEENNSSNTTYRLTRSQIIQDDLAKAKVYQKK